ncbi:MAG: DUF2250 domain-containing protein [candidate division Zixibacteria bacterium]|nr:DUF2250 domain-containing protein [candidate division Zixibacteria bacterium]
MRLKKEYIIAKCCNPERSDSIIGYYSYNNELKVHKSNCSSLKKAEESRLVKLNWPDILDNDEFRPGEDYNELSDTDFTILLHHKEYGFDYSLKIASMLRIDKKLVFDTHAKLKEMQLIERVSPKIIRYRKNIVPGKWIKHRNHTYYALTEKGKQYLRYKFLKK